MEGRPLSSPVGGGSERGRWEATSPATALRKDRSKEEETRGTFEARVFVFEGTSFHPKAYVFHGAKAQATATAADTDTDTNIAYVGSSNLSRSALEQAIEWNYRVVFDTGFESVARAFDRLFRDPRTRAIDAAWVESYRKRRPERAVPQVDITPEPPREVPEPHKIQREALEALTQTRAEGNASGLVVLATGLGKTWLSAFDTVQLQAKRVLFVAHRAGCRRNTSHPARAERARRACRAVTGRGGTSAFVSDRRRKRAWPMRGHESSHGIK